MIYTIRRPRPLIFHLTILLMKKLILTGGLLALTFLCSTLTAQKALPKEEEDVQHVLDSIEHAFQWKTGHVDLPGNFVGIDVPASMRYLNAEQIGRAHV